MRPFQQLRKWLRHAPTAERIAAGIATAVVLALFAWAVIPVAGEPSVTIAEPPLSAPSGQLPGQIAPTPQGVPASLGVPGVPPPGSAPGTGPSGGPAIAPRGGATAAPGAAASRCSGLRATDQGVTPREVFVAVSYINIAGEAQNDTFGIRNPAELEKIADADTAGINSQGGVACRKLRIAKYDVNPLDPVDQQRKCQQIIDAKPFAVVDVGGYLTPAARDCFIRAKLPFTPATSLSEGQLRSSYPYLYSLKASADRAARNFVFEAAARGWLDQKTRFRKLGLFLNQCYPNLNDALMRDLRRMGVRQDQMSVFTVSGCQSINPPAEISAAIARHHAQDDVSHVYLAGGGANSQNYVRQADGIGWKPFYMTSDYQEETSQTLAPDWSASFDGAVAITSFRTGERNSNIVAPWVTRCNAWAKKAGVAPTVKEEDQGPLSICDMLRLFAFAANGAGPNLTRSTLVQGLGNAGRFEGALYTSVNQYRPGDLSGGDFQRGIRWHVQCTCWKVIDRTMKPGH